MAFAGRQTIPGRLGTTLGEVASEDLRPLLGSPGDQRLAGVAAVGTVVEQRFWNKNGLPIGCPWLHLQLLPLSLVHHPLFYYPRWCTDDDNIIGYVPGDNRAGPNYRVMANRNSINDVRSHANRYISTNDTVPRNVHPGMNS